MKKFNRFRTALNNIGFNLAQNANSPVILRDGIAVIISSVKAKSALEAAHKFKLKFPIHKNVSIYYVEGPLYRAGFW